MSAVGFSNRIRFSFAVVASAMATCIALAQSHSDNIGPETYVIDPTHTFVIWEAKHFGTATSRGRFDRKEGSITIDTFAKTGKADISIDLKSISTGTGVFDRLLQGKNFFNSDEFPTAIFKGDQFKFDGDKVAEIAGTLTLNGKTNSVTLKANNYNCHLSPVLRKQVCGGDFDAHIKRSDFGMNYLVPFVSDATRLVIQIEAIRQ